MAGRDRCPFYLYQNGLEEFGTCDWGCHSEPACMELGEMTEAAKDEYRQEVAKDGRPTP